jgi:glycosyltransferase involved in cell wall biosynthesis
MPPAKRSPGLDLSMLEANPGHLPANDILEKPMPSAAARPVLLLAFHFPPEGLPGAVRPARFFKYLPEFGYQPEVITGAVQAEVKDHIHALPAPTYLPNKYTLAGAVEIMLHLAIWPSEMALLWSGPAFAKARRLIRNNQVSAIVSTAPPLNVHLTALALKLRYGIPWIADFRDPMLDNPFRQDWGRICSAADHIVENQIFKHADAIVGVTDVVAGRWRVRYPQYAHKLHVLYNGYDPAENLAGVPIPPRPYRTLSHFGNFYGMRRPDIILNALVRLLAGNVLSPETVRIQFVGGFGEDIIAESGSKMAYLRQNGIVENIDLMPRPQALERMMGSDYLMLLDIQEGEGYTVPSKLFEYIRVGRPILTVTQPDSPVERIISRSGVPHVLVHPGESEDSVAGKVQQLFELPSDPVKPSDWFLENFDGRRQTGTLASILESIGAGKK